MSQLPLPVSASRRPLILIALLLAWLLPGAAAVHAQFQYSSINARTDSGIDVQVTGYFSELPISGYAPLRIQITNRTKGPRKYNLTTRNSTAYGEQGMKLNYTDTFSVDAGEQRTFEVMAPLATMNDDEYVYNQLNITLTGQDIINPVGSQESQHRKIDTSKPLAPFVAISKRLSTNLLGKITAELKDVHGIEFVGGSFDPGTAPADWRAYAGVDTVFITSAEMEGMAPGAVAGLLDWVAQGGTLYMMLPPGSALPLGLLGSPEIQEDKATWRKGLGKIIRLTDGETDATARAIARTISGDFSTITTFSNIARKGYDQSWPLQKLVRSLSLNAPIILIFMLGFAVLVGPVNLFVFAKAKQRYRLFWTTPLISLGTSLLLFIVILLQDGTGGSGARTSTIFLLPGANKMVHFQEQLSRTGLLFGQNFTLPEGVYPAQLVSHNKRLAFQADDNFNQQTQDLKISGTSFSGDWFRSRERQAQLITAVSATRGKVDIFPPVTEGEAPTIQSSIGQRLEHFYYATPDHSAFWKAEKVDPGERITLKTTSKQEFEEFLAKTVRAGGRKSVDSFNARRRADEPFYIAEAERPSQEYMMETLPSVRWKDEHVYFISFLGSAPAAGGDGTAQPARDTDQ